jgi:hypothetical protein
MIWSAARITLASCSTTTTVLPASRQLPHQAHQLRGVARVQADARLVQDE